MAQSYADWWHEAGLHSVLTESAHGWRGVPAERAVAHADRLSLVATPPLSESPPAAPIAFPNARAMPDDLAGLCAWLASDPAQPEASWFGPLHLPPAKANARLLIITDMPDEDATDSSSPVTPPRAALLAAMLGSIGVTLEDATLAPLAMRRPPGGIFAEADVATLAARMRHYLALATPGAVLILGDRTSRAMNAVQAIESLAEIQHEGGTIIAAALPSLEHLMRRPTAKAASWRSLRLLSGVKTA